MPNPLNKLPVDEIKYESVRSTIEDGDILLFAGRDAGSWVIRGVTWSHYSHVGIAGWWGTRLMVMEAKRFGVRASRLSHVVRSYHGGAELWKVTSQPDVLLSQRKKVVELAQTELGKEYSSPKVLGYWKRLVAGMWGGNFEMRVREQAEKSGTPDDFFCSEYVSYAWREAGLPLTDQPDHFATPDDLSKSKVLVCRGGLVAD